MSLLPDKGSTCQIFSHQGESILLRHISLVLCSLTTALCIVFSVLSFSLIYASHILNVRVHHIDVVYQKVELPEVKPIVNEYRLQRGRCKARNRKVSANLPRVFSNDLLGLNAKTTISSLSVVTSFYTKFTTLLPHPF